MPNEITKEEVIKKESESDEEIIKTLSNLWTGSWFLDACLIGWIFAGRKTVDELAREKYGEVYEIVKEIIKEKEKIQMKVSLDPGIKWYNFLLWLKNNGVEYKIKDEDLEIELVNCSIEKEGQKTFLKKDDCNSIEIPKEYTNKAEKLNDNKVKFEGSQKSQLYVIKYLDNRYKSNNPIGLKENSLNKIITQNQSLFYERKKDEIVIKLENYDKGINYLAISNNEESYRLFCKDFSSLFNIFDNNLIFLFFLNAFTEIGSVHIFLYHPNSKICFLLNKNLRDLQKNEKDLPSLIKKAITATLVKSSTIASEYEFIVVKFDNISRNQNYEDFSRILLKKDLVDFFQHYARTSYSNILYLPSKSNQPQNRLSLNKQEYLLFALNEHSPLELLSIYIKYLNQSKDLKVGKKCIEFCEQNMYVVYGYYLYTQKLSNSFLKSPFEISNSSIPDIYISITRDVNALSGVFSKDKDEREAEAQNIFSILKGNKKEAFFSYLLRKIFSSSISGKKKKEAVKALRNADETKDGWKFYAFYLVVKLLGGEKNE